MPIKNDALKANDDSLPEIDVSHKSPFCWHQQNGDFGCVEPPSDKVLVLQVSAEAAEVLKTGIENASIYVIWTAFDARTGNAVEDLCELVDADSMRIENDKDEV